MNLKFYTFLILFFGLSKVALAQQTDKNYCGYTGYSPWLSWYQDNKTEIAQLRGSNDTTWLYAPVTVHIVGKNNGTGYFRTDQAIRAICEMNAQFEPAHIRFYFMPGDEFQFHDDTDWFEHDWDSGSEMINTVYPGLEDRLNAFVVEDPAGNCGYSWQDVIVLAKSCSAAGNSTWAHEAGHHFSLPHPFYGWEGQDYNYNDPAPQDWGGYPVEKMDQSNCYEAGDRFCDTRPDYLNFRWPCNENFESLELQHDPNGTPFRSDATLIMGYAYDNCQSRFTDEQMEAMRTNLYTEHASYLTTFEPGAEIADDAWVQLVSPIDTQIVQYNNFTVLWNPVPNATMYHVQVGMTPTFSILLFNGTVQNTTSINITKGIPNNRILYWRVRAYNNWDVCQPDNYIQTGVFKTHNSTATSELEQSLFAELAPNPVAGGAPAKLLLESDDNMNALLTVTDAAGRVCQQQKLRLYFGENQIDIPTAELQSGLYIVTIQNERGALIKRMAVTE
ncbi:MAG: T9SS type A sorting domain-containing protein [Saprospiraceae bacterium]|nr:T9SS type A sorting domain-containing protein [Saprospiraceae bacterium]